jgi:mRNA-degrading endonuclease toxin of MazEF toxin-antitoxin module
VINCDGIHTLAQASLTTRVGFITDDTMGRVCSAISYALDC